MGLVEQKLREIGFAGDREVVNLLAGLSGLEEELISPVPGEPDLFFGQLFSEACRVGLIYLAEQYMLIDALRPYLASKEKARFGLADPTSPS